MINARASGRVQAFLLWWTFDRLLTLLTFLAVAAAALLMPAQNDTWWHLRAGAEIWRNGGVPLHDTFSFTVSGAFWPNHEWLSQAVFYALYVLGGLPLLTIGCALAVIGAWIIAWRLAHGSARAKCLLIMCVLPSATTTWTLRPQVLSLLLTAIVVALLSARRYRWLPPLFLVWANLHGAVLTGILLLTAALVAAMVEDRRAAGRLATVSAICALMTLATPLGLRFWTEIPAFFVRVRLVHIEEFTAPQITEPLWIPFWAAGGALIIFAAVRARGLIRDVEARVRGDITVCACALALLVTAVTATRNVGPFLMIAVPALSVLVPRRRSVAANPAAQRVARVRTSDRAVLNCATGALAALGVCAVVAYAYVNAIDHLRWTPLPAPSLAAIERCDGNLYNRFDEGGYVIWFVPRRKVFIDSRYFPYPDDLLQEHVRIESSGEVADTFRRYHIHCAFVPAQSLVAERLVAEGWSSLYRDGEWTVLASGDRGRERAALRR